jgi:hypothetical protein
VSAAAAAAAALMTRLNCFTISRFMFDSFSFVTPPRLCLCSGILQLLIAKLTLPTDLASALLAKVIDIVIVMC